MKRLTVLVAVLLSLPSLAFAQKRRSVGMPDNTGAAVVIGTVVDAETGAPVASATITAGKGAQFYTSAFGTFSFKAMPPLGNIDVTAGRTGYDSATVKINGAGTHEVTFRLHGRPTATLQKADGTTLKLDDDSVAFGYVVPFMNYRTSTGSDFCMTDGTQQRVPVGRITRITGLGTSVPSSCCQRPAQRVMLELRDDSIHEATFIDSCYGYSVDLIARDHDSGDYVYIPFSEVSELVLP